jgi:protein gp37
MGDKTGIEWTDATWNPWQGCHHVSPGCDNCYMFAQKRQYGKDPERVVRSKTTFNAPLRWKEPALVFTCSWSDFFIAEADAWRGEAWSIIEQTPHLTYQILTKRPSRIKTHIPWTDVPWRNVWLGVSVESRKYLYRIDVLRTVNARLRFLSLEPLLEDLDGLDLAGIGWVIVGGESGPGRRPFQINWLKRIAELCGREGVPLFVKQDTAFRAGQQGRIPDALWSHAFPPIAEARS